MEATKCSVLDDTANMSQILGSFGLLVYFCTSLSGQQVQGYDVTGFLY